MIESDAQLHPIVARLRMLRKARGIRQSELSALIGVSSTALSAWECGSATPNIHGITRWAASLGCEIVLTNDQL